MRFLRGLPQNERSEKCIGKKCKEQEVLGAGSRRHRGHAMTSLKRDTTEEPQASKGDARRWSRAVGTSSQPLFHVPDDGVRH